MVTGMVGQAVAMDDESAELLKQLAGRVMNGNVKPIDEK
jgi:hypothetical protein